MRDQIDKLNPRGFSLIEVLISLFISTLIIASAAMMFMQNQRVASANVSMTMLHANLRYSADILDTEFRCFGGLLEPERGYFRGVLFNEPIVRFYNQAEVAYPDSGSPLYRYYTRYDPAQADAVQFLQLEILTGIYLRAQPAIPSGDLQVTKTDLISVDDFVVISDLNLSDAGTWDIFRVTGISDAAGIATQMNLEHSSSSPYNGAGLSKLYPQESMILKLHSWRYYIQPPSAANNFVPRLVRDDINTPPEVVAEFIEDFQLAVGIDLNEDENIDAQEWRTDFSVPLTADELVLIRAIRLGLTGRTPGLTEQIGGANLEAGDTAWNRPQIPWADRPGAPNDADTPFYRSTYYRTSFMRNMRTFRDE